jgi:hypothetical protein
MKLPLIISYHTPDKWYTAAADKLKVSLDHFGLDYYIEQRKSAGDWWLNSCQKTWVIRDMMLKYKGRNLLWIDADSEVVAYPELALNMDADLATLIDGGDIFDTTMFIRNNHKVLKLINKWINVNMNYPYHHTAAQNNLNVLLKNTNHGLVFKELPMSYGYYPGCKIEIEPIITTPLLSRNIGRSIYPKQN